MIKIALIGYGQMGKLLEKLAPAYEIEIVSIIDPVLNNTISRQSLQRAEICIEFTNPVSVLSNVKKIAELKKNIVIGTTGWSQHLNEISEIAAQAGIGIIHGSNFSLGMNLFFILIEYFSKIMNQVSEYDVWGLEKHHNKKVDSPSGTAEILTGILLKNLDSKKSGQFDRVKRKIEEKELHFASIRSGNIPGEHIVGFDSKADSIELKHTARNREGLAIGALKAAEWVKDKKGIYNFKDTITQILDVDQK